jgi:hypothetical protein
MIKRTCRAFLVFTCSADYMQHSYTRYLRIVMHPIFLMQPSSRATCSPDPTQKLVSIVAIMDSRSVAS